MKQSNYLKLLDLLKSQGAKRPTELCVELGLTPQALHRHLKKLLASKQIIKKGSPPIVYYEGGDIRGTLFS